MAERKCRCTARMIEVDGELVCPHRCPPVAELKPRRRIAPPGPREPARLLGPGGMERAVREAAKRIGVPSMAWGAVSAKGAAESRARRMGR